MSHLQWVRAGLCLSVPFNFIAAYALLMPASALGQLIGLPSVVPLFYTSVLSFMVFGFGLVYAWLATSAEINRPVLTIGAIGKAGVFCISFSLWLMGEAPGTGVAVASGDLLLAMLWASWLLRGAG